MASLAAATMAVPPMPEKCIFFTVELSVLGFWVGVIIARSVGVVAGIACCVFLPQRHREMGKGLAFFVGAGDVVSFFEEE